MHVSLIANLPTDETDIDENLEWLREYQHTSDTTATKRQHQNRTNAGSSVESSASVLELLFPFLQHNSKRRAVDNTTMKKVGSNSTLSTFMSSEVSTIDDVTNRSSILVKRMGSQTSSCGDDSSDNSHLPSPKKARRGSSVGSYSDASTVSSSSPSSPPIKRILFQAEDEVLHTNACSPVVMMKRHHHHNREASSGFGWYLDEEDFNLYQHYFK